MLPCTTIITLSIHSRYLKTRLISTSATPQPHTHTHTSHTTTPLHTHTHTHTISISIHPDGGHSCIAHHTHPCGTPASTSTRRNPILCHPNRLHQYSSPQHIRAFIQPASQPHEGHSLTHYHHPAARQRRHLLAARRYSTTQMGCTNIHHPLHIPLHVSAPHTIASTCCHTPY